MPAPVYILFGAIFTVATCIGAGKLLARRLALPFDRYESVLFGFLLGGVLVSTLTFLLSTVHLARKGWFLAAGLIILCQACRGRRAWREAERGTAGRFWWQLLLIVGAAYTVLYFFNAMAPEISPDGSTYHLGLVSRYLREHGFRRLTTNMYANLSQGVEMLFLFAFAFGKHSAAAMVHLAYLLALPAAMILYARRTNVLPAGICAAILVFASPLMGIDGTSAYIDVATACVAFGLFYLLEIWDRERTPGLLIAIGLLAGFAYAVKYTAALAVPYAVGFVAWQSWRARKPVLRPVLTVALCAAVVMLPWIVKNSIWLQNPFSPFLNALFPNPYVQVGFEREYSAYLRHYETIRGYHEIPWALAVDGRLTGFLGPVFLLVPLGLLALTGRTGRRLLLAAVVFGATYFLNIGARFLLPALPFLALALAIVLIRWKPLAAAVVVIHAVISWPSLHTLYCQPTAWRLHHVPLRAALRLQSEDSFLDANLPNYRMARLIDRTVPAGATVLSLDQVAEAYTTRRILVKDQAASNQVLGDILWTPLMETFAPDWRLEFRIPAATARRIRVVQTARSPSDQWDISELRVFAGNQELERAPEWRLQAKPNPWDIQLAFDNAPITRWRTWLPIQGGEFVQIDFGRERTFDRVLLECAKDQYKIKPQLEAMDAAGAWKTLAQAPQESDAPKIAQLRRMATEELKLRGVDYLVVYRSDFGMEDLRSKPDQWGITAVGVQGDDRLYKIN